MSFGGAKRPHGRPGAFGADLDPFDFGHERGRDGEGAHEAHRALWPYGLMEAVLVRGMESWTGRYDQLKVVLTGRVEDVAENHSSVKVELGEAVAIQR